VGFIFECIEFSCGLSLILMKFYLENYYNRRHNDHRDGEVA
jgi:hypothetical protein